MNYSPQLSWLTELPLPPPNPQNRTFDTPKVLKPDKLPPLAQSGAILILCGANLAIQS